MGADVGVDVGEGEVEDAVFGSEPDVLGAVVVHQAIVMDVEIEVAGMRALKLSGWPSHSCWSYSAYVSRLLYLRSVVRSLFGRRWCEEGVRKALLSLSDTVLSCRVCTRSVPEVLLDCSSVRARPPRNLAEERRERNRQGSAGIHRRRSPRLKRPALGRSNSDRTPPGSPTGSRALDPWR